MHALIKRFRELEFHIESSTTFLNILLPIMIYSVTGAGIFGLQFDSLFSLLWGIIWGVWSLILTSVIFVIGQSYLHRYLMNLNTYSDKTDKKINSILTNIATLIITSVLFVFLPPIRGIFSHWPLPLSLFIYLIRAPNLPIHQYIDLTQANDSYYDYYHLELPLTLSIALACGIQNLVSPIFIISIQKVVTILCSSFTEQIEYSKPHSDINAIDTDRIFRPIIQTHHLIYASHYPLLLSGQSIYSLGMIVTILSTFVLLWMRDQYVRTIDSSASSTRLDRIKGIRTYHNRFYNYWTSTFEVSKITGDNWINLFIESMRWILFYPIHILLSIVSNILSGRKRYASLYIRTLDLLILIIASYPIQIYDRYYLGILFILYNMMDLWTQHITRIMLGNTDVEKPETMVRNFKSIASENTLCENTLSDAPSYVLIDAGISEDAVSEFSENVVLSEVTDESTVISTYQNRPVRSKRSKRW